ncbi:MAG: hypothetical protein A2V66_09460 [Ignavibacteria bacterium RBG_13_36_8]|nr:MAG: hypothetical protein A2V66_09460 [Ignavibacteria bacterium RBG_13_36_8]
MSIIDLKKNSNNDLPTYSLRRVFQGASIFSIGEVLIKSSTFFLIPLYTRFLTPEDYGIIGYLQVFFQVGTVLLAFGFYGAQTLYYYENRNDKIALGEFYFSINIVQIVIGLLFLIPVSVMGFVFNWSFGLSGIPFYPLLNIAMWTVLFQVLAQNVISFYQAQQKYTITTLLQIGLFFLVTGLTILLIVGFTWGVLGQVTGLFLGTMLFTFFTYWTYLKHFSWKISFRALKYAAAFGAPVAINTLAAVIHNVFDRIILEGFVTMDELGIYTLGFSIGSALNMFIMAFNQAYQPMYFQLMSTNREDKEYQIIRTFKVWLIMMTAIAMIGIIFGGPFLKVFVGPRFVATIHVFPWIILAVFFGSFYFFFSSAIFFFKKTKYLPIITGVSAVINIGLNLLFIPYWGIIGSAKATVISHIVQSLFTLIASDRLYRIRWPAGLIVFCMGAVTLAVFIAGVFSW